MVRRLLFPLITLFWLTMNGLLWRAEWGGGAEPGSGVPAGHVWQKMLTAPDNSALAIWRHGKNIGYCRWTPNVSEELTAAKAGTEDYEPEGRIKHVTGYTIDLDGNFALDVFTNRVRFNLHVALTTNQLCRELALKVAVRPGVWELRTGPQPGTLTLKHEAPDSKWEQAFTWADLQNPDRWLQPLGLSFPLAWIGRGGTNLSPQTADLGLKWEAQQDWLAIGHAQVRVYRLQARLLDRYRLVVMVSRVGEILRLELPNDLVLINDALINR